MKSKLLLAVSFGLIIMPTLNFGQAPALGTCANFALFSSVGAVSNTGISQITGNVGTNSGSSTGFGNVNGNMDDGGLASAKCATDLLTAYSQLNSDVSTFFLAPTLGNGQVLGQGVYSATSPLITLSLGLTLDAKGDANAVFVFKLQGAFSSAASSKIYLINGAKACNVFWKIEGAVSLAAGTTMRGTIIANNAAIEIFSGDTLEGRALTTGGAVTVHGVLVYTPIGCGSPFLTGPSAPNLASTACYALFSGNGAVANAGVTNVTGDVGTNVTTTTGYDPLLVKGTIHPIPDLSTAACATDLGNVFTYLNSLPFDIQLLYPAQFGNNLVLTPHTYLMNAAVTFTDTLYLNAESNPNAVFVIQVNGAFGTSTHSNIVLINGTQARNVFWVINGAVSINDSSVFNGTIICNNGAVNLNTGVLLNGRALTTDGALSTTAMTVGITPGCGNPTTTITTQPANQTSCIGNSVSFFVTAKGTGLTYQWRNGTINLINGGNISGATTDTLTINPVNISDTSSFYNVVIGGSPNDTSANASLKMNSPIITSQPVNQAACVGGTINFSVSATGTGLLYQWRKGTVSLINGGSISGANSSALTINPVAVADSSSFYNVIISGACAPNDTSANATLAINTAISRQPVNQRVCVGSSVSFSVGTTGSGITYQWMKGAVNLTNGGSISGATSDTLTINPASASDASSDYKVHIIGSCASHDTSINVSLKVNTAPDITLEPVNQSACPGTSVSFSVVATGVGLTYQWRKGSLNLVSGGNILDASAPTLVIDPVNSSDTGNTYNVIVTGGCSPSDTSITVSLNLNNPVITSQPISQTVCTGGSASFSVAATGSGLTYQWRKGNTPIINGGSVSGANSATLTISPANVSDTATDYNVIVSGSCSPSDTSSYVSLLVNMSVSITTEPSTQTACTGSTVSFFVTATGAGLSYQWRKGTSNLTNGGDFSGTTTSTLIINPANTADTASDYNVVITGICSPGDTSANVSLLLFNSPEIDAQPVNETACPGGSALLSVAASGSGLSYQWRRGSVNLTNTGSFSGVTSSTLMINPVTSSDTAQNYNVLITGICPVNDTSINVSLTFNTIPVITNQPVSQTACSGKAIHFTVVATGTGLTYQWRKGSVGLTDGGTVSGSNLATLTIDSVNLSDAGNYNVIISGICSPTDTSVAVMLIVNQTPIATINSNSPICAGTPLDLSAKTVSGGIYSWSGPSGYHSAAQDTVILSSSTANTGTYSLLITANGCTSELSTVTVVVTNCLADLSVVKTVNNLYPIFGHTVVFTIKATNNGPDNATGVLVKDLLLSGYSYVSSTTTLGTYVPGTGIWTIDSMKVGVSALLTITATVNSTGDYTNTAIISGNQPNGNPADSISTVVTYPTDFFIPEGFSPNGDGINDAFVIRGLINYPENNIMIFNRWGDKVFGANPYLNNWNGNSTAGLRVGGDALPTGTYFYVLELGDGSAAYKGTIYLNR